MLVRSFPGLKNTPKGQNLESFHLTRQGAQTSAIDFFSPLGASPQTY